MRLQKRSNRPGYDKFTLDITPGLIRQLGWEGGTEIVGVVAGNTLVLRPAEPDDQPAQSNA